MATGRPTYPCPTTTTFSTSICTCCGRSHEPAGPGAGRLTVLEGDVTGDEGGDVAVDALHQPAALRRKVEHHLGLVEPEVVEVDQVDVGALAGFQRAAVVEAVDGGRPTGLQVDRVLDREART